MCSISFASPAKQIIWESGKTKTKTGKQIVKLDCDLWDAAPKCTFGESQPLLLGWLWGATGLLSPVLRFNAQMPPYSWVLLHGVALCVCLFSPLSQGPFSLKLWSWFPCWQPVLSCTQLPQPKYWRWKAPALLSFQHILFSHLCDSQFCYETCIYMGKKRWPQLTPVLHQVASSQTGFVLILIRRCPHLSGHQVGCPSVKLCPFSPAHWGWAVPKRSPLPPQAITLNFQARWGGSGHFVLHHEAATTAGGLF